MSVFTLDIKTLQVRNDTAANWATHDPVLAKGEIGIVIDATPAPQMKVGDGVKVFSQLPFAGTVVAGSTQNGYLLINGIQTKVYELIAPTTTTLGGVLAGDANSDMQVDNTGAVTVHHATKADQFTNTKTISVTGAVTGSVNTDFSSNPTLNVTLEDITLSQVSDAGSAAACDTGTGEGNVPVLDANGKLNESVIPAVAITDISVVTTKQEMLALTGVQKGDICTIAPVAGGGHEDEAGSYILGGTADPSVEANWILLRVPQGTVLSVNGKTGVVVLSSADLSDGNNILHSNDTYTLDCGGANQQA